MYLQATSFAAALAWSGGVSAASLQAYNADPNSVSVSGLSAGGFMAAQLGVTYSDVFKVGFGVFAGGPFDCARSQTYSQCMNNNSPSTTAGTANIRSWSGDQIDNISNLKDRKVYLEVGTLDTTVGPNPMDALNSQLANFVTSSNVRYDKRPGQAHTFPTDHDGSGDNACGSAVSPYISNCGFDGAGAVLAQMYGTLKARNSGTLTGTTIQFDQTGAYGASGMATAGYLYVPQACQSGSTVCKVHVSLHGCLQSYGQIGSKYIDNTGYNKWADTNKIIIVYPQTTTDYTSHSTPGSGSVPNPNACFDWIGWYGSNYDQHDGSQVSAIVAQVKRIVSGFSAGPGSTSSVPSPTGSPTISTTTNAPTPAPTTQTVTCAYAGQWVLCAGTYEYCYYYGQKYTC